MKNPLAGKSSLKKYSTTGIIALSITALSLALPECKSNYTKEGHLKCSAVQVPEDMKCVPGGPFLRGSARSTRQEDTYKKIRDEFPEEKVTVSTFFMDTNEVTYSQYQKCVKAGKCKKAGPVYSGYDAPDQPMVGMSWFDARDYCTWRGKRLPTEAEFEKASRGPEGEIFPWGNSPADCKKAVIKYKGKRSCGKGGYKGVTFPVGSRPAYRYGLYDIAGNSWEWVNDWYSEDYSKCGKDCRGKDPKGPCNGADKCPGHEKRVLKGGSWYWTGHYAAGSNRRPHYPKNRPYHHFGFRCAKAAAADKSGDK